MFGMQWGDTREESLLLLVWKSGEGEGEGGGEDGFFRTDTV
jgi:hypothetical protein